jgi:hypothetical protein
VGADAAALLATTPPAHQTPSAATNTVGRSLSGVIELLRAKGQ